jgi:hypothetical protein
MECSDENDIKELHEAIHALTLSREVLLKKPSCTLKETPNILRIFDEAEALSKFNTILDTRRACLLASSEGMVRTCQKRQWRLSKEFTIVARPSDFCSGIRIHKANDDLMDLIFRINHIPIRVTKVPADGNCYFYSIREALLDIEIPNVETRGVFAGALRWLVVRAVERYNEGSDLMGNSLQFNMSLALDGDEDISESKVYVDLIPCSVRLSFAFKMDITCIAVVWNNKDEQFVIEVKSFQYQKEKYEKWSSDTTLKDKTSIHEWDPDNDKLAINKFRQVGGVANFVEYKEHRIADGHSAELSSLFEHRPNHIVIGCSDVLCKGDVYRGHHCALVNVNTEVSTVSVHEKEHLTNLVSWMQKESREEQSLVKKQMQQQKTAAKKSGNKNAPNPAPLPPELVERSTDAIHESWGENDYFLLAFVGAFGPTCQSDEALKNKFFDLLKAAGLPLDDIDGSGTVVQRPTDLSSIMATASRLLDSTALSDAASKVFTVKDDCFFSVKEEIPALTESGEQLYLALEQFTQEERNLTSEAFFNRFKSLIGSKRDDVCTQLQGFIGPQKVKPQQNKKRKDMGNNQQARRRSTRISSTNPNPAKTASDDKELIDDGDENEDLFAKTASDDKEEEQESIDDDDETKNLFDSDEELGESNKYQKVDR